MKKTDNGKKPFKRAEALKMDSTIPKETYNGNRRWRQN